MIADVSLATSTMIPPTLGIDFGTKRIGVAISQATLAEPLTVIPNDEGVMTTLLTLCQEHAIAQLVIGVSEGEMAVQSREFGLQLASQTKLPVFFTDETLTTKEAHTKVHQPGVKHSKRFEPVDHLAAAHLLQEWIDEHSYGTV